MESGPQRGRTVLSVCLLLVSTVHCRFIPQCENCVGNGFGNCSRTFIGSFDQNTNWTLPVQNFVPQGLEQFAHDQGRGKQVAEICEGWDKDLGGTFASYYDCNLKIPLYTAISLTGYQLGYGSVHKTKVSFRNGTEIKDPFCQGNLKDYTNLSNVCSWYYDENWYPILDPEWQRSLENSNVTNVNRGHSTASLYSMDFDTDRRFARKVDTFVLTNIIPQFAGFNKGSWRDAENRTIGKWAKETCELSSISEEQMKYFMLYIITGTVPSTCFGNSRFFGPRGFSNIMRDGFPINLPTCLWMAACCKYKNDESDTYKVKSIAFYGKNLPTNSSPSPETRNVSVAWLTAALSKNFPYPINLFPGEINCR